MIGSCPTTPPASTATRPSASGARVPRRRLHRRRAARAARRLGVRRTRPATSPCPRAERCRSRHGADAAAGPAVRARRARSRERPGTPRTCPSTTSLALGLVEVGGHGARASSTCGRTARATPTGTSSATTVPTRPAAIAGEVAVDHVLGVGGASLTLARITPRTPVGRALDLGTGCGVQALHLGRHAGSVVATDRNRRARSCSPPSRPRCRASSGTCARARCSSRSAGETVRPRGEQPAVRHLARAPLHLPRRRPARRRPRAAAGAAGARAAGRRRHRGGARELAARARRGLARARRGVGGADRLRRLGRAARGAGPGGVRRALAARRRRRARPGAEHDRALRRVARRAADMDAEGIGFGWVVLHKGGTYGASGPRVEDVGHAPRQPRGDEVAALVAARAGWAAYDAIRAARRGAATRAGAAPGRGGARRRGRTARRDAAAGRAGRRVASGRAARLRRRPPGALVRRRDHPERGGRPGGRGRSTSIPTTSCRPRWSRCAGSSRTASSSCREPRGRRTSVSHRCARPRRPTLVDTAQAR